MMIGPNDDNNENNNNNNNYDNTNKLILRKILEFHDMLMAHCL